MSYLIIGQNVWGHANNGPGAKKNFKAQGGKLSSGYTIVEFTDGREFTGVDELGRVHWSGNLDQLPAENITDIAPRGKAGSR